MRSKLTSPRTWLSLLLLGGSLLGVGCSTTSSTPTARVAPRSSISREHALNLAQLTATTIGGQVFAVAPTGSMKPTLDESSVVTVEKISFAQLRQGDIVIYRNTLGAPVIHRLYENRGDGWLVLGDNNSSVDREAVTASNFVGRVCAIFYTAAEAPLEGSAATALAQR